MDNISKIDSQHYVNLLKGELFCISNLSKEPEVKERLDDFINRMDFPALIHHYEGRVGHVCADKRGISDENIRQITCELQKLCDSVINYFKADDKDKLIVLEAFGRYHRNLLYRLSDKQPDEPKWVKPSDEFTPEDIKYYFRCNNHRYLKEHSRFIHRIICFFKDIKNKILFR